MAKDKSYKVPVVTVIDVPVEIRYPVPSQTCVDKLINVPNIGKENYNFKSSPLDGAHL